MAQHDDQLNKRRERREELRRKREAEQKRLKIGLIAAAVVLVLGCVGMLSLTGFTPDTEAPAAQAQTAKPTEKPTQPTQGAVAALSQNTTTTIHIKAAGDLNVTDAVVNSGLAATGYNFSPVFMDVGSLLADADLTVLNLEGNINGEPYGTERTSAPAELLTGLRKIGVDLIQLANSCSINNGLIGLSSTLQAVRNAGMVPLGAYANEQELRESKGYTICNVNGVKIAFVAFTKGLGGRGLPTGSESLVNLLYTDYDSTYQDINTDGITKILKNVAAEKPDVTIAMLHWGSEYKEEISKTQTRIASLMQKNGVDVIIGTHPHLVQQIEYDEAAGTLVAYSLGDFFGDGNRGGSNYSIVLDVEITKDSASGITRVTGYSYTPVYTRKETDCVDGKRRVVRIEEAMDAYTNNFVDKVTVSCYNDMEYSLTRIKARTKPVITED